MIPRAIRKIKRLFYNPKRRKELKRLHFLEDIVETETFAKLPVQDKIISLAKLISLSKSDMGYAPPKLEMTLLHLSNDLQRRLNK
jgi:hypothetical protein